MWSSVSPASRAWSNRTCRQRPQPLAMALRRRIASLTSMPATPRPRSTAYIASKASITSGACRRTVTTLAGAPSTAEGSRGVVDITSFSRRGDVQRVGQSVLVVPGDQRRRERHHACRGQQLRQLAHVAVGDLAVVDQELLDEADAGPLLGGEGR